MTALSIEALRSLRSVAPLRAQIDALNLESRRPCPFSTFEYLQTFLAHDEYGAKDEELLFLVAFDAGRLVGYLPLRKRRDRIFGLPFGRIELMVSHDTDRPHVVARAEDERRCSEAFYRRLLHDERGWSLLELGMQDEESGLGVLPQIDPLRFYVRRFPTMPNSTVPLPFASFGDYFASLAGAQRRNVARLCRRLMAAGNVEVVSSSDPRARQPMLDLYLDLERRSWKEAAHAGVRRHPERVAFFRALGAPEQPLRIGFDFVLLDDLPISGLLSGEFAGGAYGIEMAFDEEHEELAPGHLLSLMAIRRGIEGGFRSFNFDGNYSYYKSRMGGVVTETAAVQIYRVGSLPWLKARVGELQRRRRPAAKAEAFNPERRKVAARESQLPARVEERALARTTLRELEASGASITRTSAAALEAILPFLTRREAA